jgi:predicted dehydrogenase
MARQITRRQALGATAAALGYLHLAPARLGRPHPPGQRQAPLRRHRRRRQGQQRHRPGRQPDGRGRARRHRRENLAPKAKKWPEAKTFSDFRKLFDDRALLKNIDAFVISTPDHTHAIPAVLAMRAGKHVYCQKPLTHDVAEALLLRAEAKKNKVCTQMATRGPRPTGCGGRPSCSEGELGEVTAVHVWTNRPIWPQAPGLSDKNPPKKAEAPEGHRLGARSSARPRTGSTRRRSTRSRGAGSGTTAPGPSATWPATPPTWRSWGCGSGTRRRWRPRPATSTRSAPPSWAHVTLDFPKRDAMPPVVLHWYEGKKGGAKVLPPDDLVKQAIELSGGKKLVDSGSIVVGSKGFAYSPDDYGANVFFSTGQKTGGEHQAETMPENNKGDQGQKDEWVKAIKEGKPELALSNFDYAGLLTAAFLLGNVAIRTGKPFNWDGEKGAADLKEAAPFIRREYRKGGT